MDELYRLFDRRCRTDTAMEKLARLRRRVHRFKWVGKTLQKRIALDMQREQQAQQRDQTTRTLHAARPREAA